jgi:hypothetical protein
MFTVTLGVHNLNAFEPSVKRSISKIIIVKYSCTNEFIVSN